MRSFLSGVGDMASRNRPSSHPLLEGLLGQTVVHTRVAARGTWTVTARGWVVHSRIQQLHTGSPLPPDHPDHAVTLRDPRLVGAAIRAAEMLGDGTLRLALEGPHGPVTLSTRPRWRLTGPRRALLEVEERGGMHAEPPGGPLFAEEAQLAEHAASRPSAPELRLLSRARERWIHPGDVVEVLTAAGALEDEEFERRGPTLLARMLCRGELRAGFVTGGVFSPWALGLPEVVEHIGATWTAIGGRTPGRDMIAWFELTDVGRRTADPDPEEALPPGMSGYDSPGVVGGFR